MNKKTAFGATAAAAALVVVGAAAPAMAADYDYSSLTKSSSRTTTTHFEPTTVLAPSVDALNGDISAGDILGGNSVGSGNSVDAPLLSGNETAVGNGNETALGNVTGNDVSSGDVSTGDVSTDVSDLVDNVTDLSVGDVVDVSDILGDVGGWVDVSEMFED